MSAPRAESYTCAAGGMPNIVGYWGNGGDLGTIPPTGILDALDIPEIYNVLALSFLLFDENAPGGVPQWCVWTWGAGQAYANTVRQGHCGVSLETITFKSTVCNPGCEGIEDRETCNASALTCAWDWPTPGCQTRMCHATTPNCISPPSDKGFPVLPNLDKWKEREDPWGRRKYIVLSMGGAPQEDQGRKYHVLNGIRSYDPQQDVATQFARDPDIKALYDANLCDGFDIDVEGDDREGINEMVLQGTFSWGTYVTQLKEFYGDDFTIITAAPEIASVSLDMFVEWFKIGPSGNTIFTGIPNLEYFVGTQFYNNGPMSVRWHLFRWCTGMRTTE